MTLNKDPARFQAGSMRADFAPRSTQLPPTSTSLQLFELHPCRIAQQWCLVHHPDLAARYPRLFRLIGRWATRYQWQLVPDRRRRSAPHKGCRRLWLSGLVLSLGCWLESGVAEPAAANQPDGEHLHLHAFEPRGQMRLDAPSALAQKARHPMTGLHGRPAETVTDIRRILADHWLPDRQDPAFMVAQLDLIAAYFAGFPEVHALLQDLHGKNWQLRYREATFNTRVSGSALHVDEVQVFFDPFSAGQLKFHNACQVKRPHCVASPADVLLHELLHAHAALLTTERFAAAGGLSNLLYPHAHEADTIHRENRLYRAMTRRDQHPRPLRREHRGRALAVSCAVCLE